MKAALKGRYETENGSSGGATITIKRDDYNLYASLTHVTFPKSTLLGLTIEQPDSFIFDCNLPSKRIGDKFIKESWEVVKGDIMKDVRFQFIDKVWVAEKLLTLSFIYKRGHERNYATFLPRNRSILDGTLVLNSANKVSANYVLDTNKLKLKYAYDHKGDAEITFGYNVSKNSWDFALSKRVNVDHSLRTSYQTASKILEMEWSRDSKLDGTLKISASLNLAEELKLPKVTAETTWNFDM